MHPDGCFLFVLNELAGSICVLDLRMRSAAATPVLQTVMLGAGDGTEQYAAADIRITPDGRFLYASERTSNALIGFAVDADSGSLTKIGIWDTEASPRSLAIDPAGCVLVAAGQESNHVSIYRIDRATGRLIWLFRHRTHGNPSWVEIARFPVHR
jgi:6-phosphogluconolactonase